MTDLIVAGAGPAGLATAILGSLRGLSAVVLESRTPPLEKACGEGLMPYGVAALEEMGVRLRPGDGAPFAGVRYLCEGRAAEARFRGRPGLGIERSVLSARLLERAASLGVEIRFGTALRSWESTPRGVFARTGGGGIEGRFLVGADGLHSFVRRRAGLQGDAPRPGRGAGRFGVRRHYAGPPLSDVVEVHLADGVEAYVTPTGPRRTGVALLWSPAGSAGRAAARTGGSAFEELLSRFPALKEHLAEREPIDPPLGAGPFPGHARARTSDRIALVGDAAGYRDPLTGDGVAVAFASARALVETVASAAPLSLFEAAWRGVTRRHRAATRALLAVAERPPVRRCAIELLGRRSAPFEALLELVAGARPRV